MRASSYKIFGFGDVVVELFFLFQITVLGKTRRFYLTTIKYVGYRDGALPVFFVSLNTLSIISICLCIFQVKLVYVSYPIIQYGNRNCLIYTIVCLYITGKILQLLMLLQGIEVLMKENDGSEKLLCCSYFGSVTIAGRGNILLAVLFVSASRDFLKKKICRDFASHERFYIPI